jgi:hypothetical protein
MKKSLFFDFKQKHYSLFKITIFTITPNIHQIQVIDNLEQYSFISTLKKMV